MSGYQVTDEAVAAIAEAIVDDESRRIYLDAEATEDQITAQLGQIGVTSFVEMEDGRLYLQLTDGDLYELERL